jgi:hypothetical protein
VRGSNLRALSGHPRQPEYKDNLPHTSYRLSSQTVHYFYVITEGPRLFLEAYQCWKHYRSLLTALFLYYKALKIGTWRKGNDKTQEIKVLNHLKDTGLSHDGRYCVIRASDYFEIEVPGILVMFTSLSESAYWISWTFSPAKGSICRQ